MHLLLVDGSSAVRQACQVAAPQCVVEQRRSGLDALTYLRSKPTSLVFVGSAGNRQTESLAFVQELLRESPGIDVILLAAESSEEAAVAALRAGAWDYLAGGPDPESIRCAMQRWQLCRAGRAATQAPRSERIIGSGEWTRHLRARVAQLATSNCGVLITGETGTGKEVVAEAIHAEGARGHKPFVCVNCAAVPDSLFESEIFGSERGAYTGSVAAREGRLRQAHGGTVFLDEIGDMSMVSQAKILRAIETKSIQRLGGSATLALDVRIVAATNQPLEELCDKGLFRRDLFTGSM